ncbi:glycosyltransferase [Enterococcus asini]|uniref:glycosyltransferase family 2 protein n=1 Tax=Enterococcus asini TaxID=57732 RepID=UPI0032C0AC5C
MISIIIPVFNVDLYLFACLESVIRQSVTNFEVILVDDGSTDNSAEICRDFCNKDKRFNYYYQQNSGVSAARNFGIKVSKGKWLAFIDPDDFVSDDYLKNLLPLDSSDESELIGGGFILKVGSVEKEYRIKKTGIIDSQRAISVLIKDPNFYSYVWNKLFLRDIIKKNNISFDDKIYYGEDLLFIYNYLKNINRVKLVSMSGYFYCRNENSVGGALTREKLERKSTYIDALSIIEKVIEEDEYGTKKFLINKISLVGSLHRANLIQYKFKKEKIQEISEKINPYLKNTLLKDGSMKERLKVLLFYLFPVNALKLMKYRDRKNSVQLFS